jgi:ATP-dependent DNA helicase RecG
MQTSIPQLNEWLSKQEGLNIEFKLARNNFSNTELCKYCCALSNEGGGKLIFGVEPKKHTVVGTSIWQSTSNTVPNSILVELDIRIDIEELVHPNGRVLIVHVPPHPIGRPIAYKGVYYMRAGEAVVSMDTQTLTQKLTQSEPDFSAVIVPSISLSDLDSEALLSMRRILISRNNTTLAHLSD